MLNTQSAVRTLTSVENGIRIKYTTKNTCMQKPSPRLSDKTLCFLNMKNYHGNTIILRIVRYSQYRPPLSVINISIIKQTIHQYLKQTYLH